MRKSSSGVSRIMETGENAEKRATRACFEYLESGSIFRKMLDGFVEKYRSYGEVCGSVRLRLADPDSVDLLEGFLGKSLRGRKSVTISADALRRVIASSCFAGANLEQVLFLHAGGSIPVRKEMKFRRQELYRTILQDAARRSEDPVMRRLAEELHALMDTLSDDVQSVDGRAQMDLTAPALRHRMTQPDEKYVKMDAEPVEAERDCGRESAKAMEEQAASRNALARILMKRFGNAWNEGGEEAAAAALSGCLALTAAILGHLPVRRGSSQYLAVFASDVTGNPHSFDRGAENGPLAEAVLRWYVETYQPPVASFFIPDSLKAVRRGQLFLRCGVMIDDVSNYVTVYGIRAMRRGGREDQGMQGFWAERAAVHVPLSSVMEWTEMRPAQAPLKTGRELIKSLSTQAMETCADIAERNEQGRVLVERVESLLSHLESLLRFRSGLFVGHAEVFLERRALRLLDSLVVAYGVLHRIVLHGRVLDLHEGEVAHLGRRNSHAEVFVDKIVNGSHYTLPLMKFLYAALEFLPQMPSSSVPTMRCAIRISSGVAVLGLKFRMNS